MLFILRRLMKNENGATAIEYTLIASLIAVAAITAMNTVGGKVNNTLNSVAISLTDLIFVSVETGAVRQRIAHFSLATNLRFLPTLHVGHCARRLVR